MWQKLIKLLIIVHCSFGASAQCKGKIAYNACGERCSCTNGRMTKCTRIRRDFMSMAWGERLRFVRTFLTVTTKEPYKSEYDGLVSMHTKNFKKGIHTGFGTMTFGPLLQFLLETYGLNSTLRILSAIMALLVLASLTYKRFRSPLEQIYGISRTPSAFFDGSVWKNKAFVLYTAAVSLFMLGYFIPCVHVISLVADAGISPSDGAMLISYMSISSTLSRIVFGKCSDHPRINRLYMTQVAIVGYGAMTFLCAIVKSYRSFVGVMVMLGLFDGMYVVLIAVVVTDIVGVHKLNQALGNLYGVISFAIFAGPPFAGFLYDALLSYNTAFYICAATATISSLLLFLVPVLIQRHNGRRFERDSVNSRLDSLMSVSRSTNGKNADDALFGVSTKSGLRSNERIAQKRLLMQEHSTIYSEEFSTENSNNGLRENSKVKESGRAPRARSISFASDKDPAEPDELFMYQPSHDCNVFDSDSGSSSSGCILSNSFNTSQNTSFNSSMSNRGSITKVLLLRHLSNDSSTRPPDQCREVLSPKSFRHTRQTPSNSFHKNIDCSHISKETVV